MGTTRVKSVVCLSIHTKGKGYGNANTNFGRISDKSHRDEPVDRQIEKFARLSSLSQANGFISLLTE